jgi:hypothetical protein
MHGDEEAFDALVGADTGRTDRLLVRVQRPN